MAFNLSNMWIMTKLFERKCIAEYQHEIVCTTDKILVVFACGIHCSCFDASKHSYIMQIDAFFTAMHAALPC